jgi:hypothetical protein|tara:strand:+ start:19 stop:423 length:405 start_codon:yes stop_codon:yes gene_type:complete
MLLYDWKKIKKESNGNVKDIMTILHILTYKLPPVNRHDRIFKFWQKSFHGDSFLVNPEPLFIQRRRYSDSEIAQYAGIASLRNYYEYQKTKDTTLDFLYFGKEDIIESNRLLWLEGDRIHFKFEEINKGEIKWQ